MRTPLVPLLLLGALFAGFFATTAADAQLIDSLRVDQAGAVGRWSSIALDADENPHIAYIDSTNLRMSFAEWNGASFDLFTVDTVHAGGMYCDLVLDDSGEPHISYYAFDANRDSVALYYATRTGSDWIVEQVETGPVAFFVGSSWTGIDWSPEGPGIVYQEIDELRRLKYAARGGGGTWGAVVADSTTASGFEASLVFDSEGIPHVSHTNLRTGGGFEVRYTTTTNLIAWESEIVASVNGGNLGYGRIDLLEGDVPVIAYLWGTDLLLYVTARNGAGETWEEAYWDTAGLGASQDTRPISMTVDAQNRVNVAYYHERTQSLRYAREFHDVPFWITVDENGNVGEFSSIALDAAEAARISYYDIDRKDLMYATAGVRLDGIEAIPATADIVVDSARALSAQADFRSGFVDITFESDWTSRDEGIARVDSFGFVVAVSAGSTYVVADFDTFRDSVLIRVQDPERGRDDVRSRSDRFRVGPGRASARTGNVRGRPDRDAVRRSGGAGRRLADRPVGPAVRSVRFADGGRRALGLRSRLLARFARYAIVSFAARVLPGAHDFRAARERTGRGRRLEPAGNAVRRNARRRRHPADGRDRYARADRSGQRVDRAERGRLGEPGLRRTRRSADEPGLLAPQARRRSGHRAVPAAARFRPTSCRPTSIPNRRAPGARAAQKPNATRSATRSGRSRFRSPKKTGRSRTGSRSERARFRPKRARGSKRRCRRPRRTARGSVPGP